MLERPWGRVLGLVGWLGVPAFAIAYLVAVAIGPMRPAHIVTSYPRLSPGFAMLDLAAGGSLLVCGAVAWLLTRRLLGLLAALGGGCWFGVDWAGFVAGSPALRLAGMVASTLTLPILIHLVLLAGRAPLSRRTLALLGGLYAGMGTLALAWITWYVPQLDPRCLEVCDLYPITSVGDHRLARQLSDGWHWLTIVAALALAGWAAMRLGRRSSAARRTSWRVVAPALAIGSAWSAWAIASLQVSSVAPPTGPLLVGAFVARAAAVLALTVGLGWMLLEGRRMLASVRQIAHHLSPFPGGETLQASLASAIGDRGMQLVFALPRNGGLVDADGRPADALTPTAVRSIPIEHRGEVVAFAVTAVEPAHDALGSDLGAAVRLAAANERLLAAVRHEVLELRASRARIVAAADSERHRLERDLHDGAQQRMLGVLYELSIAEARARAAGDEPLADGLARATHVADTAIEALRMIARGIHHAVLTEAGLVAALEALAIEAPIPVEVDATDEVACRQEMEAIVWRVVADTVAQSARLGAVSVRTRLAQVSAGITLDLEIDGLTAPLDLVALHDRVGAGGGSLSEGVGESGSLTLHAELPCG